MSEIDYQTTYWDRVASEKTFTHPFQMDDFNQVVPIDSKILDYGCGYGRTCAALKENGYKDVVGVDTSLEMIKRGLASHSQLDLRHIESASLPFPDEFFTACTLMAVLTCIPTDPGQEAVIAEIQRVLKPEGILFVSDYPLQADARNQKRYNLHKSEFGTFGVFRLPDGGVVRHHDMDWIYELLSRFARIREFRLDVSTMNGNKASIFQIIAQKN